MYSIARFSLLIETVRLLYFCLISFIFHFKAILPPIGVDYFHDKIQRIDRHTTYWWRGTHKLTYKMNGMLVQGKGGGGVGELGADTQKHLKYLQRAFLETDARL